MDSFKPKIVGLFCNWCSYRGADLAGTSRLKYAPNVKIIRVMCSGRVDERLVLKAFALGADGVLVCGCHPGECHYHKGNLNARRRITGLKPFVEAIGIGKERLRLEWISASEGPKVAETVNSFTQTIKQLGPSAFNRRRNEH
ncbi:MAG: hydrogenase iron-sulfur subunit [Chloroflexi bacterium]|jgi:F420-non-reducing hydrogenase iron-sulfur subunit|nr:hydrogenase iron-sulfur subunit [Chloroflexota bacterium]MBL7061327.1 hydrogenase iron-sulfur subunit [Dehalococcoidia bacterium]